MALHSQCVQVKLEFGHSASIRTKPSQEGFTHDWIVFVRGSEGNEIQHFVEKVIFNLHESFPKSRRGKPGSNQRMNYKHRGKI